MAKISPFGKYRAFDTSGSPLNGGKLYTYEAGTSTPKSTFTTEAGDVANANPVILDANGEADVWLNSGSYKFVLDDSADVNQWTTDNIVGAGVEGFASSVIDLAANLAITSVYKNYLIDCTASLTLTLLAAASADEGFVFTVKNTSSGDVTIDPDGAELIDGASTLVIGKGLSANIVCTGTAWKSFSLPTIGATNANTFSGDNTFTGKVITPDSGELTIATGAITVTGAFHTIDTEADAASDDLDTISGGVDGQTLTLRQENDARDVTITEAGNIVLPESASITLRDTKDVAEFIYDGALAKWVASSLPSELVVAASTTVAGISKLDQYLIVREEQTSGTNAGTFTSGAWQTRVLNTTVVNEIVGASLSTNQITLPAGDYEIEAKAPAAFVNMHQARLQNITDASTINIGLNTGAVTSAAAQNSINHATIVHKFTLAATKVVEIQHRCFSTRAADGFGNSAGWGTEIYTSVLIKKIG